MSPLRVCNGPGNGKDCPGSGLTNRADRRCPDCAREFNRSRSQRPTNVIRDRAERDRRAAVVAAWRARYGDWCPGWQCDPHPAMDLTADHVVAAARGGTELAVLCRECNSRKGAG